MKQNYVTGVVSYADTGDPVSSGGTVLIEVSAGPGKYVTLECPVEPDGSFSRDFENPWRDERSQITLHYLGAYGAAACELGPIDV